MLKDDNRICSMDEANVDVEFGKRVKVFCDSSSHPAGSRADVLCVGGVKHITSFMAAPASGLICPPLFIVQDTNFMSGWLALLNLNAFRDSYTPFISNLREKNGFEKKLQLFASHVNQWISRLCRNVLSI